MTNGEFPLAGRAEVLSSDTVNNPFADYTKVFVPYCTGDIHWGNRDAVCKDAVCQENNGTRTCSDLTVRHRGAANLQAVFRWLEEHYAAVGAAPPKVVFSGGSAGAYGALLAFVEGKKRLPNTTRTYVLSDSGNGVVTDGFLDLAAENWGLAGTLPLYFQQTLAEGADGLAVRLFGELAWRNLGTRFGQFQNAYDLIQGLVFNVMKNVDEDRPFDDASGLPLSVLEWTAKMRLATNLTAANPNYRFYTAAGCEHAMDTKGNFEFERRVPWCRSEPVLDLRRKR